MTGLTTAQLEEFDRQGYLVVDDVLTPDDLAAIEAEYAAIMEREAVRLIDIGALQPLRGVAFAERYVEALQQLDDMYTLYEHLDISHPLLADLSEHATMNAGAAVFRLLTVRGSSRR